MSDQEAGSDRRAPSTMPVRKSFFQGILTKMDAVAESQKPRVEFMICELPPEMQEAARKFDPANSGVLDQTGMMAALQQYEERGDAIQEQKRIIGCLVVALTFVLAAVFGLTFLAIDLSKDFKPADDGTATLKTADGTVVKCGSADFEIDAQGALTQRSSSVDSNGRRLNEDEDGGGNVVTTNMGVQETHISSCMDDDELLGIESLSVPIFQDGDEDGAEVTMGAVREVFRDGKDVGDENALCGSHVFLRMDGGILKLTDSELFFVEEEVEEEEGADAARRELALVGTGQYRAGKQIMTTWGGGGGSRHRGGGGSSYNQNTAGSSRRGGFWYFLMLRRNALVSYRRTGDYSAYTRRLRSISNRQYAETCYRRGYGFDGSGRYPKCITRRSSYIPFRSPCTGTRKAKRCCNFRAFHSTCKNEFGIPAKR